MVRYVQIRADAPNTRSYAQIRQVRADAAGYVQTRANMFRYAHIHVDAPDTRRYSRIRADRHRYVQIRTDTPDTYIRPDASETYRNVRYMH